MKCLRRTLLPTLLMLTPLLSTHGSHSKDKRPKDNSEGIDRIIQVLNESNTEDAFLKALPEEVKKKDESVNDHHKRKKRIQVLVNCIPKNDEDIPKKGDKKEKKNLLAQNIKDPMDFMMAKDKSAHTYFRYLDKYDLVYLLYQKGFRELFKYLLKREQYKKKLTRLLQFHDKELAKKIVTESNNEEAVRTVLESIEFKKEELRALKKDRGFLYNSLTKTDSEIGKENRYELLAINKKELAKKIISESDDEEALRTVLENIDFRLRTLEKSRVEVLYNSLADTTSDFGKQNRRTLLKANNKELAKKIITESNNKEAVRTVLESIDLPKEALNKLEKGRVEFLYNSLTKTDSQIGQKNRCTLLEANDKELAESIVTTNFDLQKIKEVFESTVFSRKSLKGMPTSLLIRFYASLLDTEKGKASSNRSRLLKELGSKGMKEIKKAVDMNRRTNIITQERKIITAELVARLMENDKNDKNYGDLVELLKEMSEEEAEELFYTSGDPQLLDLFLKWLSKNYAEETVKDFVNSEQNFFKGFFSAVKRQIDKGGIDGVDNELLPHYLYYRYFLSPDEEYLKKVLNDWKGIADRNTIVGAVVDAICDKVNTSEDFTMVNKLYRSEEIEQSDILQEVLVLVAEKVMTSGHSFKNQTLRNKWVKLMLRKLLGVNPQKKIKIKIKVIWNEIRRIRDVPDNSDKEGRLELLAVCWRYYATASKITLNTAEDVVSFASTLNDSPYLIDKIGLKNVTVNLSNAPLSLSEVNSIIAKANSIRKVHGNAIKKFMIKAIEFAKNKEDFTIPLLFNQLKEGKNLPLIECIVDNTEHIQYLINGLDYAYVAKILNENKKGIKEIIQKIMEKSKTIREQVILEAFQAYNKGGCKDYLKVDIIPKEDLVSDTELLEVILPGIRRKGFGNAAGYNIEGIDYDKVKKLGLDNAIISYIETVQEKIYNYLNKYQLETIKNELMQKTNQQIFQSADNVVLIKNDKNQEKSNLSEEEIIPMIHQSNNDLFSGSNKQDRNILFVDQYGKELENPEYIKPMDSGDDNPDVGNGDKKSSMLPVFIGLLLMAGVVGVIYWYNEAFGEKKQDKASK